MINFNKIRWKNFLSYGNHWTEVNLNQNKSTLVIGENGAGKSTVLDALTFVLYNKPFRKVTVQQLINSINDNHMEVEVEFSIGKNNYKVARGQKPRKFEVYSNGEMLNQEAHAKDYQEVLEKNILKLNHKSFCQVVVLGSSSFIPFMQLPNNHRKEVIEDLLDIGIFSIMSTLLKDKASSNRRLLGEVSASITLLDAQIDMQKEYIEKMVQKKDELIQEKEEAIEKLTNTNGLLDLNLADEEEKLFKLRKEVRDEEKIRKKLNQLHNLDEKIGEKVKRLRKEIEFFHSHDDCPTCNQTIDEEFKQHSISSKEDTINECNEGFDKLETEITETQDSVNHIVEVWKDIDKVNQLINNLKSEINANQSVIDSLQNDINRAGEENIDEERKKITDLNKRKGSEEEEKKTLSDTQEVFNIATTLLKDTGIKSRIIKQYVPIMNKLINKFLTDMGFFAQFSLDENFNETIKSRHRDQFSYMSFSEGEKMRIDLALLLAWREIARLKNSANTNLLILDEVFDSSLDSVGTEEFMKLMSVLSANTHVFVISHKSDQLVDKFDNQITFVKTGNFSKLTG